MESGSDAADIAADLRPDAPVDVTADAPPDAAADLAPDVAADKAPDLATDPPPVDLPADLPADLPPPDLPADLPPDLPADLPPPDLPADLPPDLPVDPPPPDLPADLPPDLPVDPPPDLPPDSPAGTPPSCAGLPATCGPSGSEDCCASPLVPGGTYNRSNDPTYPATVSDFRLDRFEITVGRFRKFVEAGMGTSTTAPAAGTGENPSNPAGTGWDSAWNASLKADTAALKIAIKCSATYQTWTDMPGGNERRPMNCIDWYEAFAFCIWDGGRLATEAEWNYGAAGGSDQREYPWSSPPTSKTIDDSYAVYCGGSCSSTQNVGSKSSKGDGRWGQADLAGNVWEWNFDWYAAYIKPCINCANTTSAANRVFRGGGFYLNSSYLLSSYRFNYVPAYRNYFIGSRCARTP